MTKSHIHPRGKSPRAPTPEQKDLERRINALEVKSKQDLNELYSKIARIRAKIRVRNPEKDLPQSDKT